MKLITTWIAAGGLLAALAAAQPAPHYTITDLGTFGGAGTNSGAYQMNQAGWVGGAANQTSGGPQHAFLWYGGGQLHDLGTLGGSACSGCNSGADGPNAAGEAAIDSEISTPDPNGEDFCQYGTHAECLGAIWRNGKMTALPTLVGGNNASAFNLNIQGQVIGFSENGVADSTCSQATPYQVIRFEPVIWGPTGTLQELAPLSGDTVAFATGVNDLGQVVGVSGLCSNTGLPPIYANGPHAVLWQKDGTAVNLGSLGGGTVTNAATSINNLEEVVGGSQSPEDGYVHPFLWTPSKGMQDLGILSGDTFAVAPCCNTVNNKSQVVGQSCPGPYGGCRAFLWQNGVLSDLNTLIPSDSGMYLEFANSINDAGEIAGCALINGELHAVVLTPR